MKRVLGVIIALVMVFSMVMVATSTATAETKGYPGFVSVGSCTLRKEPIDSTAKKNRIATLKNGYTMTIVGETGEYYVIQPSSIKDREGNSLNLSDDAPAYVKKKHVAPMVKQYVVIKEKAELCYGPFEDQFCIGEKSKVGEKFLWINTIYDGEYRMWYIVQVVEGQPGVAFIRAEYAYLEQAGERVQVEFRPEEIPESEQEQPEEELPEEQFEPELEFEPEISETEPESEPEPEKQDPPTAGEGYAKVLSNTRIRTDASENADFYPGRMGVLKAGTEVVVTERVGDFARIIFEYDGQQYAGYVPISVLSN